MSGNGKKPWYKSKGVWGGILTFLFSIISVWYEVDVNQEVIDQLSNHLVEFCTAGAGILALIGRVLANTEIDW